jgi:predicted molibdopterin-dependent oxidoreductase YjgC
MLLSVKLDIQIFNEGFYMSKVNLTIDGQKVTVPAGTTILTAARQLGIDIPTLCYDPELPPNGACRLCVVEVEKAKNLTASCVTPVVEGMVVQTESERVVSARKSVLSLMIANHPLECITCERTGNCKLQDYCYRYGISESEFVGEVKKLTPDDTNPFFIRDMNKCILCGICVGKCQEIVGAGAIDFVNRGFDTLVAPPYRDPIENSSCVFCGMCVDSCPVGALIPKAGLGQGRPWEIEKVKTICPYCGTGCSVYLHIKDGKIIGASPDPDSPVNRGHLCTKGRFGWDYIQSEDRLTKPLIKKEGVFVEVEWDEALNCVAEKFNTIKDNYGADAIAALSSAKASNEDNYLMQKLMRSIGTNNIDHCARL